MGRNERDGSELWLFETFGCIVVPFTNTGGKIGGGRRHLHFRHVQFEVSVEHLNGDD